MALRSLRCSILILTLALTACATERDLTQDNRVPTNYKADILAFLRTYLNDPTNVRDASASQPTLQHVGAGDRYVVCVRFNARKSDGKYGGVLDTAAIFNGGKLYSFPIFSFRQNSTSLWFFKEGAEAAGVDPEAGPATWDEARKAAKAATKDGKYGLMLPLQFGDRMKAHLIDLAQMAGAAGEVDWKTGEYAHASQPFLDALEFLMSFQKDGSLNPGSSSVDARQGRARWVAGESLMFFSMKDSAPVKDVPETWYQVRKKVGDIAATLPQGI